MNRLRRRSAPVAWLVVLVAALTLGGNAAAQSPAPSSAGSPGPTCTPLPPLTGWTDSAPASPSTVGLGDLTVFAAASLNKPFTALAESWTAQHPGSELTFSFDASSALRAQVEQGAPVDVFVSADLRNAQTLVDGCLAHAPLVVFAANHLVLVVPTDNPAGIDSTDDLATPGVRLIAAGDEVPITRYAEEVIANLAALPGTPPGFVDSVHANIVSREDNVAAVLAKIELGEGDAGLVYASDAANSDGVTAIAIPNEANVLAEYAAVQVGATADPGTAAAFLGFLSSPEVQAILGTYGFLQPR